MRSSHIYLVAAALFGFGLPFLKQHVTVWWQVGAIAFLYFGLVRFGIYLWDRKHQPPVR